MQKCILKKQFRQKLNSTCDGETRSLEPTTHSVFCAYKNIDD